MPNKMSFADEELTDEVDYNKVQSAPDAHKDYQDHRRQEEGTNSLMDVERWSSKSIGYSVAKHTSRK